MSARENIADNLVDTLKNIASPNKVKLVTREPFDFDKLSNAQFPAILVRTQNESREDSTIGGSMTQRSGSIDYQLVCYVKAKEIDTARNNIIEAVEEKLDIDRTRGGYAVNTQVISVETDDGSIDPVGGALITVRVVYRYNRGTT